MCKTSLNLVNVLGGELDDIVVLGQVGAVPATVAVDLGRPALGDGGGTVRVEDGKALDALLEGLVGGHPLDVGPNNGLRGLLGDWGKGAGVEGVGEDWTGHVGCLGLSWWPKLK